MINEYLLIGEITRPQGVRGEMRVRPYTDDPMRFEELDTAYVRRGEGYEPREVGFVRLAAPDVVIIRMKGGNKISKEEEEEIKKRAVEEYLRKQQEAGEAGQDDGAVE